jgi:hypothetical protein
VYHPTEMDIRSVPLGETTDKIINLSLLKKGGTVVSKKHMPYCSKTMHPTKD